MKLIKILKVSVFIIVPLIIFILALYNDKHSEYNDEHSEYNDEHSEITTISNLESINTLIEKIEKQGGGTVYLPKGTFILEYSPIILKSNVSLVGDNAGTILVNNKLDYALTVEGNVIDEVDLGEDVYFEPVVSKPPFIIHVTDASRFSKGDSIQLFGGENNTEFNKIATVDQKNNTISILDRPAYKYQKANTKIKKIALIENTEIKNLTIQQDVNVKAEDVNAKAAVFINYAKNVKLNNNTINNGTTIKNSIEELSHNILLQNTELIQVKNNNILGGFHGISIQDGTTRSSFYNNTIRNVVTGIALLGHRNIISDNTIIGAGAYTSQGDGVTIYGNASENMIKGNLIESGNCYGIWITGTFPKMNMLSNNIIRSSITTGLYVNKGEGHTLDGNIISYNSNGITVEGAKNIIIKNNQVTNNSHAGILIYNNTDYVNVKDNNFEHNGTVAVDYANDISAMNSDNFLIKANFFSNRIYTLNNGKNGIITENFNPDH